MRSPKHRSGRVEDWGKREGATVMAGSGEGPAARLGGGPAVAGQWPAVMGSGWRTSGSDKAEGEVWDTEEREATARPVYGANAPRLMVRERWRPVPRWHHCAMHGVTTCFCRAIVDGPVKRVTLKNRNSVSLKISLRKG